MVQQNHQNFQSGIVANASPHALFVTLNRNELSSDQQIASLLAVIKQIPNIQLQAQASFPQASLHVTFAISSSFWDLLKLNTKPAELIPFQEISNAVVSMPATNADVLLHIRSDQHDVNYHIALDLYQQFKPALKLNEMIHGFRYLDSRDLTGFVDGTENPEGDNREAVALVANNSEFNGGSYVHLQKYQHNLESWEKMALKQQENSYGRTKADNIEYSSADKLPSAHTKRASAKNKEGESLEILRHSLPFGDLQNSGLLFASFGSSPENFNLMLQSMCSIDDAGSVDKILHVTSAVTGDAFFAPGLNWFESL